MQVSPLQIALWSSAWVGAGWLAGHYLAIGRDANARRAKFRSYLVVLRRKLAAKGMDEFVFDQTSRQIGELERESLEVRHCIREKFVARFDASLEKYKSVSFDQWSGPDRDRQQARDTANQKTKDELLFCLDELSKCAR
jgi:hypothetical protein